MINDINGASLFRHDERCINRVLTGASRWIRTTKRSFNPVPVKGRCLSSSAKTSNKDKLISPVFTNLRVCNVFGVEEGDSNEPPKRCLNCAHASQLFVRVRDTFLTCVKHSAAEQISAGPAHVTRLSKFDFFLLLLLFLNPPWLPVFSSPPSSWVRRPLLCINFAIYLFISRWQQVFRDWRQGRCQMGHGTVFFFFFFSSLRGGDGTFDFERFECGVI